MKLLKSISFVFILLFFSLQALAIDKESTINDLESEFQSLLMQEENRFLEEKDNANKAEEKMVKLVALKLQIIDKIDSIKGERESKFFKYDLDKVRAKYEEYLVKIDEELEKNKEVIFNFRSIEKIY